MYYSSEVEGSQVSVDVWERKVIKDGVRYPIPFYLDCDNIKVVNGEVYIDGYKFCNGKWKKTVRSLLYNLM